MQSANGRCKAGKAKNGRKKSEKKRNAKRRTAADKIGRLKNCVVRARTLCGRCADVVNAERTFRRFRRLQRRGKTFPTGKSFRRRAAQKKGGRYTQDDQRACGCPCAGATAPAGASGVPSNAALSSHTESAITASVIIRNKNIPTVKNFFMTFQICIVSIVYCGFIAPL